MAVVVNVSHRYPRAGSRDEQLAVVRGDWPVPEVDTPEAFAESDDAQELLDAADVLVAAASNEVVDVQRITGLQVDEGGHVRFETADEPALVGLVGRRLRAGAAWEPGESWPVKLVEVSRDLTEYLDLAAPAEPGTPGAEGAAGEESRAASDALPGASDPTPAGVSRDLGGFHLSLTDDGDLVVTAPPGRSVTVVAAQIG
ncbi:hypothetical protein [Oerskovia merdavium]|uniref:Uncharacterized protein n=1 Tax=Oerskovia merdavium TaxID=2762227 RepID=A0ABR8U337_9CELL|nr:hypothetical protein [Oerskovia merdavium]MBD7982093.1 hypothetical protein [Oerskovia merdavium]